VPEVTPSPRAPTAAELCFQARQDYELSHTCSGHPPENHQRSGAANYAGASEAVGSGCSRAASILARASSSSATTPRRGSMTRCGRATTPRATASAAFGRRRSRTMPATRDGSGSTSARPASTSCGSACLRHARADGRCRRDAREPAHGACAPGDDPQLGRSQRRRAQERRRGPPGQAPGAGEATPRQTAGGRPASRVEGGRRRPTRGPGGSASAPACAAASCSACSGRTSTTSTPIWPGSSSGGASASSARALGA